MIYLYERDERHWENTGVPRRRLYFANTHTHTRVYNNPQTFGRDWPVWLLGTAYKNALLTSYNVFRAHDCNNIIITWYELIQPDSRRYSKYYLNEFPPGQGFRFDEWRKNLNAQSLGTMCRIVKKSIYTAGRLSSVKHISSALRSKSIINTIWT